MKLNSPDWKPFYKNKFARAISRKHDYSELYILGRERIKNMLESDTAKKNPDGVIDFVTDYTNQLITYIGYKNGLTFVTMGFWGFISRLFGSFNYHIRFFASFNEFVDDMDELIENKRAEYEKPIRSIGFKK